MTLQELREKRKAKVTAMRALLDAAAEGDRDLTAEEQSSYAAMEADVDSLTGKIERLEALEEHESREAELDRVQPAAASGRRQIVGDGRAPKEFANFGEFVNAVRFNQNDQRLASLYAEMETSDGASGGFAVPTQFLGGLRQVDPTAAVVRPRANVIPAGSPPDTAVTMPALDQTSAENMYGGVEVSWIGEGATKPETDARLREVSLKPHEVAAHIVVTDKLLRNWQAANALLEQLLRGAITAAEDKAFLQGDGVAKPLGVVNAAALKTINRATANSVTFADLVKMDDELIGSAMSPVWVASKRLKSVLRQMEDTQGHLIWQGNAVPGEPETLLGYPIQFVERGPAKGTKGDLLLCDFGHYLIKDGSGPFVAASEHVHFKQNKTVIKAFWNVDGQPWLNAPVQGEDGQTYSPFVGLDVPA